ncbi:transmembrane protein, putative [Medicago truncatula]|uniref:Transmembrane protein, putative n=2 Tax=Medicago truncatula TaxID=3880 RepID=G7J9Q6_MEDTR|nr:transmembrane protein, putative [Medicago truncatula]
MRDIDDRRFWRTEKGKEFGRSVQGISASNAGTLAFYKGPQLKLLSHHQSSPSRISATFYALWLVLQAFVIKDHPSKLIFTTLQCLLSSIQSLAVAFAIERDIQHWKLGWNVTFLAIAYCVILSICAGREFIATGVALYLMTWVIEKKGSVFLSDYYNLLLYNSLTLEGLYSVVWGKNRANTEGIACNAIGIMMTLFVVAL